MYIAHLGIRIQGGTFHIYLRKWYFWTPRECCPPRQGQNELFLQLYFMISQVIRNESIRCSRHIGIIVSYKILQLEVQKLVSILHYSPCFQKGLFGGSFEKYIICPLGVNYSALSINRTSLGSLGRIRINGRH
jgi:hypothetical protein